MPDEPLYVAFLWHMHQPYYKDLVTGEYVMPWVRLHATKDYYSMVSILDDFPGVKQTFNLVPSLLAQMKDYVENGAEDGFLRLSRKDPESLTVDEKVDMLHNFFMANWANMVRIYSRYEDLLEKRGRQASRAAIRGIVDTFSAQDFQDLQVWFNLVWINSAIRAQDPRLKHLVEKGSNFSGQDKQTVFDVQREIMSKTIDKYREVAARGQIELTTSPFYHPIMPLLCDSNVASVARPDATLPAVWIHHPEDVDEQVRRAVEMHAELFGEPPRGMWPSEGSVSEEIVPAIAGHGVKWIATDEDVLTRSLGKEVASDAEARFSQVLSYLYRPYWVGKDDARVAVVFRDKVLSDNIGFVYQRWPAEKAVDDFVARLMRIKNKAGRAGQPRLVSIILDGENAWESYPDDGQQFLRMLYGRLQKEEGLETVRIGDYLERFPPVQTLPELWPGSWIQHDFDVWIGGQEENMAWQLLEETRSTLEAFSRSPESEDIEEGNLAKAWDEIYISEGSDWNWWYGRHHTSANDEMFDNLYRKHLRNVYQLTGRPLPELLFDSIIVRGAAPLEEPIGLLTPTIDGRASNYYEWLPAGLVDVKTRGGVMHQAESFVSRIYYGFDIQNLYVRIDNERDWLEEMRGNTRVRLSFLAPQPAVLHVFADGTAGAGATIRVADSQDGDEDGGILEVPEVAVDSVVEIGVPFALLKATAEAEVKFFVIIEKGGLEIERWPARGPITLAVPTEEFELVNWYL